MLRAMFLILMMGVVSWVYHTWLAEEPNYIETFEMLYWSFVTTVVFWGCGLIKK